MKLFYIFEKCLESRIIIEYAKDVFEELNTNGFYLWRKSYKRM